MRTLTFTCIVFLSMSPLVLTFGEGPARPKPNVGRVYTEEDAKQARGTVSFSPTSDTQEKAPGAGSDADEESNWRSQFAAAEGKVKALEREVAVLDLRLKQLNTEWLSTGAGAGRSGDTSVGLAVAKQINNTREALEAKKAELEKARAGLDSLQSKAKQASVPPGWTQGNKQPPPTDLSGKIGQTKDRSNELELELNELRNKLNAEQVDFRRQELQRQIDSKMAEIETNRRELAKLKAESKEKAKMEEPPEDRRDDAYWKDKIQSLQEKITRLEERRQSLQQSASYPRYAGFTAGDSARRDLQQVEKDLEEAHAELEKAKRAVRGKIRTN